MNLNLVPRELQTKRLNLRPLGMEDAEAMFSMLSDPETMKHWSSPPITQLEEAREILRQDTESDAKGDSLCWAVIHAESQKMIGKCILFHFSQNNHRAEIGYILNRQYWRQGLMLEALQVIIHFAFTRLKLHRIEADIDPGNIGSLAILEKLGFKREGLFRDRWRVNGQWSDSIMLGLLNDSEVP